MLEIQSITKRFEGLVAVDSVNLNIEKGQIFSLIGPNGAGKTTLFNLVSGVTAIDGGRIQFKGKDITSLKSHGIVRLGMARTFQNIRLFTSLNALENVMVARHCRTKSNVLHTFLCLPGEVSERRKTREYAEGLLNRVGLQHRHAHMAKEIPYGEQRRLEIARALATEPELLLLDEPCAGMNPHETGEIIDLVYKLRDEGITIFLIEHNMKLVMGISDRVAVLNYGRKIADGTPSAVQNDPAVIGAYLGTEQ